jgi:hypothetical protein
MLIIIEFILIIKYISTHQNFFPGRRTSLAAHDGTPCIHIFSYQTVRIVIAILMCRSSTYLTCFYIPAPKIDLQITVDLWYFLSLKQGARLSVLSSRIYHRTRSYYRILTMVYNFQKHRVFGFYPSTSPVIGASSF